MKEIARGWQSEIDKETKIHKDSDLKEGEKFRGGNSNRDSYRKTETERGCGF